MTIAAYAVIKSSEKSENEDFYLLGMKKELIRNKYKIFYDLFKITRTAHAGLSNLSLAGYVDSLVNRSENKYYPSSMVDYENYISNRSIKQKMSCYI